MTGLTHVGIPMKLWKLLIIAMLAVGIGGGAVNAAPIAVDGHYTVTETAVAGNTGAEPNLTADLATTFNLNLNLNSPTTAVNFFTATPANNCTGCGAADTAIDTLHVTFAFTEPTGATGTLTATGTFTANYKNLTDSIVWTSADPLVVDFTDGLVLNILLNNAEDWAITPTISFTLTDPTPVPTPEPMSIAILGFGLVGLFGLTKISRRPQSHDFGGIAA